MKKSGEKKTLKLFGMEINKDFASFLSLEIVLGIVIIVAYFVVVGSYEGT